MRYVPYVDFGRYPQNGEFGIALGTIAAEKLKVGIPTRPYKHELEDLIADVAQNASEGDFIRSLYDTAPQKKAFWDAKTKISTEGNERVILRKDASRSDLDRYWNMLDEVGRNDVRINAVIDIKAVPETIRADKWEGELLPALNRRCCAKRLRKRFYTLAV